VVREALVMTTLGVCLGLGLAAATTRLLRGLLVGVTPLDPAAFVAGALSLVLVALATSYFPARRAARVDPIVALRVE
jgi:putative ABC transport system permease protein